jgi:hypothetical protein
MSVFFFLLFFFDLLTSLSPKTAKPIDAPGPKYGVFFQTHPRHEAATKLGAKKRAGICPLIYNYHLQDLVSAYSEFNELLARMEDNNLTRLNLRFPTPP